MFCSVPNAFQPIFLKYSLFKVSFEELKIWMPFLCQSLLLSITALNPLTRNRQKTGFLHSIKCKTENANTRKLAFICMPLYKKP